MFLRAVLSTAAMDTHCCTEGPLASAVVIEYSSSLIVRYQWKPKSCVADSIVMAHPQSAAHPDTSRLSAS